jgi:hypothetical protein
MGNVDDDLFKAVANKIFYVPDDEWLASNFKQRFWESVGKWTHSLTPSGSKDHRFH